MVTLIVDCLTPLIHFTYCACDTCSSRCDRTRVGYLKSVYANQVYAIGSDEIGWQLKFGRYVGRAGAKLVGPLPPEFLKPLHEHRRAAS